jgi:hypothetical protein
VGVFGGDGRGGRGGGDGVEGPYNAISFCGHPRYGNDRAGIVLRTASFTLAYRD